MKRMIVGAAMAMLAAGCGDDDGGGGVRDAGPRGDAGPPPAVDAGPPSADSGPPPGEDSGPPAPPDAGPPSPCHVDVEISGDCATVSCRQLERRRDATACIRQGYLEYTPPGYGDGTPRPLLLFFHGIGENGDGQGELANVANAGIPALIRRNDWDVARQFIVLSPQHFARPGADCHSVAEIHDFIDYALDAYDVDRTRIYLTGLSCGAIGIWSYLGEHTDTQGVVAAVPIAGDGRVPFARTGCAIGRVAIWAFHGDADPTVNVDGTRVPVEGLQMCEPRPDVEMVIYPMVGHDSWSRTYDLSEGHDVYAWLLDHSR